MAATAMPETNSAPDNLRQFDHPSYRLQDTLSGNLSSQLRKSFQNGAPITSSPAPHDHPARLPPLPLTLERTGYQ